MLQNHTLRFKCKRLFCCIYNKCHSKKTTSQMLYNVIYINTPISKKVWKFAVYLPAQTSWYSIKNQYQAKLSTLKDKYGEPKSSYENFINPYYEGDGYEMSAVTLDKVNYSAFWDNGISIEISKYKQVKICYENAENSALDDTEKTKIESKVF